MRRKLRHQRNQVWGINVLAVVIVLGVSSAGTVLFFHNERSTQQSESVQASSAAFIKDVDIKIEQIKEKKRQIALATRTAERVISDPFNLDDIDPYSCNRLTEHADPSKIDVFVNKKHCVRPLDFEPSDLVSVNGTMISQKAADNFSAMIQAAASDGFTIWVSSSYRSYADQVETFRYWVSTDGRKAADTYSARPGYSEHQTGLAIDVATGGCTLDCFGTSDHYQWMQENAATYGFIQRYYKGYEDITGYSAEEWHYRYVGPAIAKDMKDKGIKTLEEYWGLEGGDYY